MPEWTPVAVVVVFAVAFDFINGFHDTANAIATSVLTRALTIPSAILMSSGLNFLGALVSHEVAKTIGGGIVDPQVVQNQLVIVGALAGAIVWNLVTWYLGLPSSSSHALIGGLIGSVLAFESADVLNFSGLRTIFTALVVSPICGLFGGFALMIVLMWVFRRVACHRLNRHFRRFQVASAGLMAFSHGANDAQKVMGIITMALVMLYPHMSLVPPIWVKLSCATAMALGTAVGGWRIIKTVGRKVMTLWPIHGFAAETAAAVVIQTATHIGAPVSTTHVISSSIMGVGSSRRLTAVRWNVAGQIVLAWVLTLPLCGLLGYLSGALLNWLF
jgi:PiT family inorganic phosphate transporter